MQYFYPFYHEQHHPSIDLSDGLPGFKHLEVPSRVEQVLCGIKEAHDAEVVTIKRLAEKEVLWIHDADYVRFLSDIADEIEENQEYIPPIFRSNLKASPLFFQGGMYCDEIGTPIGKDSIKAALNSAATAIDAASYMLQNNASTFALTRPPGHHAGKRRYGGYCFFNNSYLAADIFTQANEKVAIVDIDYHIGDGSLEFAHENAPYFSLHSNVHRNYPYFDATWKNENPHVYLREFTTGIDGKTFTGEVAALLQKALDSQPKRVILSLGFDTLGTDYCQDEYIYVTPEDFRTIGELFGRLEQKTLILLEGGYDAKNLQNAARNFMQGFMREI